MNHPAIALFAATILFWLFPSPAILQQYPLKKYDDTHQLEIQGATVIHIAGELSISHFRV